MRLLLLIYRSTLFLLALTLLLRAFWQRRRDQDETIFDCSLAFGLISLAVLA